MSKSTVTKICDRESGMLNGVCTTVKLKGPRTFNGTKIKEIQVAAYAMHYEVHLMDELDNIVDTVDMPIELADDILAAIAEHKSNLKET